MGYGIDAPAVPAGMVAVGGTALGVGLVWRPKSVPAKVLRWWLIGQGVATLAQAGVFLNTSLRGKFTVWERELDKLGLTGNEDVLDLGCGRGAVLVAAGRRLGNSGRAVGIDLWRSADQSGNNLAATQANIDAAGLTDRVQLETADMTELPFDDATFDVVLSALAIHNIPGRESRDRALDEALRVLRPGGALVITDIRHTAAYVARLGAGAEQRALGPAYWYGGPWAATTLVTYRKPV